MSRSILIAVSSAALLGCVSLAQTKAQTHTQAQTAPAGTSSVTVSVPIPVDVKARALLPDVFDGWVAAKPLQPLTDATQVGSADAAAMKEYGFAYGVLANYKRENETLSLRALRFSDTSGAYGAYTYFRQNGWPRVDIGTGAASDNNRVVFWKGDTVVDANYSRIGPMSAGELRELAHSLPLPRGNEAIAPPILFNLPQGSLDKQTTHYALGPAGYAGGDGVLPPELVGFDRDAETVTANYSLQSGPATLTLIEYPTPQIALAQEAKIRAYIKAGKQAQPPWPKALLDSDQASLEVRSSGPLVALVSGDAIPDESHRLIELVHYEDNLTSVPQPTESEVQKTGQLLLGITMLCLIGGGAAVLLGFFLGGGRALYRIARGKPASSVYETEFIRLNLRK